MFDAIWERYYKIFLEERVWIFIEVDDNTSQDAFPPGVDVVTLKQGQQIKTEFSQMWV